MSPPERRHGKSPGSKPRATRARPELSHYRGATGSAEQDATAVGPSPGGLPWGTRTIVLFFARFVVIFGVLMAPWPGLANAYAPAYRAGVNAVFGWFGPSADVQARPLGGNDPDHDTEFILSNWRSDAEERFAGSSLKGYEPTAYVLALILATPMPWSRRWRAVLWGIGFASVYAALRTGIFLVIAFSGDNDLAVFTFGHVGRNVLAYLYWVVGESFAGWLLIPLPIWVLACFPIREWLRAPADSQGTSALSRVNLRV